MTDLFPNTLGAYPTIAAYVAQIPKQLLQGDSGEWIDVPFTDVNGVGYDSGGYTLKYVLAGPTAPLTLTATAKGSSWKTNITPTQSAALTAGLYWWTAQLFATGVRVTLAEGQITILPDLALQTAGFDNRSVAEKALAQAEAALATFQATGGRIQSYTIGTRHMAFQKDSDVLIIVDYWRRRVQYEKMKANGGTGRMILASFRRAR